MEEEKYITIPQDAGPLTEINGEYYQTVIYEGQEVLMKIPTENLQVEPPVTEEENVTYCLPNGQIVSVDENDVSQTNIQSEPQDGDMYVNPSEISSIKSVDNAVMENEATENIAPEIKTDISNDAENQDEPYTGIKIGNRVIKISTSTDNSSANKRKYSEINVATNEDNPSQQDGTGLEVREPPFKFPKVEMTENERTIAEGLEIADSLASNKRTNLSALNLLTDKLRKLKEIDKTSKDSERNRATLEGIVGKLKLYKATIDRQDAAEILAKIEQDKKVVKKAPVDDEFEPPEIVCNIGFVMKNVGKTDSEILKSSPAKVFNDNSLISEDKPDAASDLNNLNTSLETFDAVKDPKEKTESEKSFSPLSYATAKPQRLTSTGNKPYSYTKQTVKTGSGKVTVMRTTKNDLAQLLQDLSKNQSSHKVYTVHCQSDSKSFIENIPSLFKGPNKPNVTVHVVNGDEHKKALTQHLATNKNVHHQHLTVNKDSERGITLSKDSPKVKKETEIVVKSNVKSRKYQQYTITNEALQNMSIPDAEIVPQVSAVDTNQQVSVGSKSSNQELKDSSQEQFIYTSNAEPQMTSDNPTQAVSDIPVDNIPQQAASQFDISQSPLVINEPQEAIQQFVNQATPQTALDDSSIEFDPTVAPKMSLRSLLSGTMFKTNPGYTVKGGQKSSIVLQKKILPNNSQGTDGGLELQIGDKNKLSPELEQLLRSSQIGVNYNNANEAKNDPMKKTVSYVSAEGVQYVTGPDGAVQCILPAKTQEPQQLPTPQIQYITPDGNVQIIDASGQVVQNDAAQASKPNKVRYVNENGEEIENVATNQIRYVTEDGQEVAEPMDTQQVRYVNERGEEVKAVTTADGQIQYVTTEQELQNFPDRNAVRYVTEDGQDVPPPTEGQQVRYVNERGEEVQGMAAAGDQQFQYVNEKGELVAAPGSNIQYVNEKGEVIQNRGNVQNISYVDEKGRVVQNPAEPIQFVNELGEVIQNPSHAPNVQYVNESGEIVQQPQAAAQAGYSDIKHEIVENPSVTENVQFVDEKGEVVGDPTRAAAIKVVGEDREFAAEEGHGVEQSPNELQAAGNNDTTQNIHETQNTAPVEQAEPTMKPEDIQVEKPPESNVEPQYTVPASESSVEPQYTAPANEIPDNMPPNEETAPIAATEANEPQSQGQNTQSEEDVKYIVTETGDVLYIVPKEVKTVTTTFQQHKYEISVNADRQFVIPVGHELQCITTDTGNVQYIVPNNEEGPAPEPAIQAPEPALQAPEPESTIAKTQPAENSQGQIAGHQDIQYPSDPDDGVQVQYVTANGEIQYLTAANQELSVPDQEEAKDVKRETSRPGQRFIVQDTEVPEIGNCQDV